MTGPQKPATTGRTRTAIGAVRLRLGAALLALAAGAAALIVAILLVKSVLS